MSKNWVQDISDMTTKFGSKAKVKDFDDEKLRAFLSFRANFLQEELDEMKRALTGYEVGTIDGKTAAEDTVDALIDLCVVAIEALNLLDVDSYDAWDRVYEANMKKQVGIKPSRPNPLGLPDLIKPAGWVSPTHDGNVGLLEKAFSKKQPIQNTLF